jgi:hypothetical protein
MQNFAIAGLMTGVKLAVGFAAFDNPNEEIVWVARNLHYRLPHLILNALKSLANAGDVRAMCFHSLLGCDRYSEEARKMLRRSAEAGYPFAQAMLAGKSQGEQMFFFAEAREKRQTKSKIR